MKKGLATLMVAGTMTMSLLTGCGHEHTWADATCTEPKTCSECGETEGEALGHTLTEANYQQAATCEFCGQTVGEPLQADFEKYGWSYVSEVDKEYSFTNKCYDSDDLTIGKVIFSDYETFVSDDNHEEKEGYEYKRIVCTIKFDDDNASSHGQAGFAFVGGDYYDMMSYFNDIANYKGTEYTEYLYDSEVLKSEWVWRDDRTAYYLQEAEVTFCVPVGYDGAVISIMNDEARQNVKDKTETIEDVFPYMTNENTINFRLM